MEDPFGDASGSDRRTRTRGAEAVARSAALERLRAIRDGSARAAAVVQVKVDAQIYDAQILVSCILTNGNQLFDEQLQLRLIAARLRPRKKERDKLFSTISPDSKHEWTESLEEPCGVAVGLIADRSVIPVGCCTH